MRVVQKSKSIVCALLVMACGQSFAQDTKMDPRNRQQRYEDLTSATRKLGECTKALDTDCMLDSGAESLRLNDRWIYDVSLIAALAHGASSLGYSQRSDALFEQAWDLYDNFQVKCVDLNFWCLQGAYDIWRRQSLSGKHLDAELSLARFKKTLLNVSDRHKYEAAVFSYAMAQQAFRENRGQDAFLWLDVISAYASDMTVGTVKSRQATFLIAKSARLFWDLDAKDRAVALAKPIIDGTAISASSARRSLGPIVEPNDQVAPTPIRAQQADVTNLLEQLSSEEQPLQQHNLIISILTRETRAEEWSINIGSPTDEKNWTSCKNSSTIWCLTEQLLSLKWQNQRPTARLRSQLIAAGVAYKLNDTDFSLARIDEAQNELITITLNAETPGELSDGLNDFMAHTREILDDQKRLETLEELTNSVAPTKATTNFQNVAINLLRIAEAQERLGSKQTASESFKKIAILLATNKRQHLDRQGFANFYFKIRAYFHLAEVYWRGGQTVEFDRTIESIEYLIDTDLQVLIDSAQTVSSGCLTVYHCKLHLAHFLANRGRAERATLIVDEIIRELPVDTKNADYQPSEALSVDWLVLAAYRVRLFDPQPVSIERLRDMTEGVTHPFQSQQIPFYYGVKALPLLIVMPSIQF